MGIGDPLPKIGQIVKVRQRLYLVEQSISPVNPGDSTLVRLSCVVMSVLRANGRPGIGPLLADQTAVDSCLVSFAWTLAARSMPRT